MFLIKSLIINNKSCKNISFSLSTDEPEVFIGINDCGKSTILKSLDVFFDEKKSLNFQREDLQKSDLSNSPLDYSVFSNILKYNNFPEFIPFKGQVMAVLCEFNLEEEDYNNEQFQESSKNTQLKLSTRDNRIVLMRVFHNPVNGEQNLTGYYLLTPDYKDGEEYLELWNKPSKELFNVRKKFGVTDKEVDNKNNEGRFKNIESVEAIYAKLKLKDRWTKYDDFSKDKSFFPSFKYLDWNFSLKELEEIATEAMNEVTEPLILELRSLANERQNRAIIGVNKKFEELMGDLKDELPQNIKKISSSVFFNVSQKITDITLRKENVDGEVHIDNQGEGIKRQIWFALLKWRSKLASGKKKKNRYLWCFDEPETHLYPSAQRQLFGTFKEMCRNEFQVLLSTHSTVFIDRVKIKDINKVVLNDGYSSLKKVTSTDDIYECLGIQNSDFLFFDKFITVEGPTEYSLIPALYKLKFGRTLLEDGIQIISLQGKDKCLNNKQILQSILSEFQKTDDKIYYLFDTDSNASGPNIYTVGRYDIEDSFSNDVWIRMVKKCCGIDIDSELIDNSVRSKLENSSQKKFHALLCSEIHQKIKDGRYLPSKNADLGKALAECIQTKEEIPQEINSFLSAISPVGNTVPLQINSLSLQI